MWAMFLWKSAAVADMAYDLTGCNHIVDGKHVPRWSDPCDPEQWLTGCWEVENGVMVPKLKTDIGNCDNPFTGCAKVVDGQRLPVLRFSQHDTLTELQSGCCIPNPSGNPCAICVDSSSTPLYLRLTINGVVSRGCIDNPISNTSLMVYNGEWFNGKTLVLRQSPSQLHACHWGFWSPLGSPPYPKLWKIYDYYGHLDCNPSYWGWDLWAHVYGASLQILDLSGYGRTPKYWMWVVAYIQAHTHNNMITGYCIEHLVPLGESPLDGCFTNQFDNESDHFDSNNLILGKNGWGRWEPGGYDVIFISECTDAGSIASNCASGKKRARATFKISDAAGGDVQGATIRGTAEGISDSLSFEETTDSSGEVTIEAHCENIGTTVVFTVDDVEKTGKDYVTDHNVCESVEADV